ncbi:hypothetical protein AB6A40_007625 [Gnathostoma spinigerum]|uniref:Uncharacterized protein n=1 Tax=Gnathostoma spinigerum TaxID=75299 RepID=A0ABD6EMA3_9BILA
MVTRGAICSTKKKLGIRYGPLQSGRTRIPEMKNEDYAQSSQESSSYNEASSGLYGNTEACHDEESVQYESSEMLAQSSQTQHYPVYSVYRPLNEFTPEHHTFIPTKTQQMCYENAIPQEDDHYIAENVEYHGNIEGFFDQETVDDEGFGDGEYVVDYGYGQQNIAHSSATQYSIVGHTPEGQPIYAMQSPPPQPQPQQPPPNAPPPYREIYRVIRAPQSTVPCQRLQSDDQEAHVFHGAQANSLQHRNIESFQPSETKIIIHNIKNSELSKRSTTAKTQGESVIPRCGSADVPGTSGGGKHKRKQSSDESSVRQSAKITYI